MTKFAKMSLVAAIALAGTSSFAGSLEDAVKNTDISGKVYVEYLSNSNDTTDSEVSHFDIDVDATFTTKVNDNVTSTVRIQGDTENKQNATTPASATATIDNIFLTYTNGAFTAMAGKMDINTPNTDGDLGDGAAVMYNFGPVTAVAAHFANNDGLSWDSSRSVGNLNGSAVKNRIINSDISAAALLGTFGPVNAELWYVDVSSVATNWTAVVSGNIDIVSLSARYAATDYTNFVNQNNLVKDGNTLRLDVGVDLAPFEIHATYLTNDEDGGALVTDESSANTYELSQLGLLSTADADLWAIGASYKMDKMTYIVDYAAYDVDNTKEEADEVRLRAKYQMSKNFHVMATYSMYEKDNAAGTEERDNDSMRLEAKYSF